jgi:3,4-dihydroxy 2-butanone 4-phosphate synthase / GTP cyclohydrolase II
MSEFKLDPIEEAIEAIKCGEVVIVVDDEDRENEGDFICAAESVTPQIINFMRKEGGGLICAALIEDRCEELGLDLMVGKNTASFETPFTVSVDLIGHGCTTGISASDRSKTIRALVDPEINPLELGKPGHIFPLKAKRGGVLRRAGHTEAAMDLARLAGFRPAGVLVEILNDEGTMARLPDLVEVAKKFNLKLVSIADLIRFRLEQESLISKESSTDVNTVFGQFQLHTFRQTNTDDLHYVLSKGTWTAEQEVLVRMHKGNLARDIFGLEVNGSKSAWEYVKVLAEHEAGLVVYMNQEDKQTQVFSSDTIKKMDELDYGVGAQILKHLGLKKVKFITNSIPKRTGLEAYGIEITGHHSI